MSRSSQVLFLFAFLTLQPMIGRSQERDPFGGPDPFAPAKTATTQPAIAKVQDQPQKSSVVDDDIRAKLLQSTQVLTKETPLVEFFVMLSRSHDIPIVIDARALEELGISTDVPVTLDVQKVSLRSIL
ncbi:MAG: hypothetical protein HKN47_00005, partial [Pirellulaceae bacterium]|nr:hypothetical protein [Pirellulaceae bacterium]